MYSAKVVFARSDDGINMILSAGGRVITRSASPESIVRELQIRGTRQLLIDGMFATEIPTTPRTLTQAAEVAFSEPLAVLKLIAACTSMGEVAAFPYPERRARPRAELPDGVEA
ncbi:MAG: hypothetical protein ACEQSK_20115 [Sphingomonadaceae bacterium]